MTENELSYKVIGTAIELHKQLGPGLLESVYELALAKDLQALGLKFKQIIKLNRLNYKPFSTIRGLQQSNVYLNCFSAKTQRNA